MTRWVIRTPSDVVAPAAVSGGPDLEGSVGGLGMTWDVTSDDLDAAWPDLPGTADVVPLTRISGKQIRSTGRRVKRTLLLRVRPGTSAAVREQFESALTAMPEHIAAIRSWTLSRVTHEHWTHAWEQEFADVDGLIGDYLRHPYHWTCVDRWFDAEMPQAVVEPDIAHLFRWADGPLLS